MMLSAESAISRFRRDVTLSTIMQWILLVVAVGALLAGPLLDGAIDATFVLLIVGTLFIILSFRSMRGSRIAADSPLLIASGQFDAAEQHIAEALSSFSLFKTVKLLSLHHLAMLRHAQRRWGESAMLAQTLLRQRSRSVRGLNRSARLILADALLEMGDLRGTHQSLVSLYQERLGLGEALNLQALQLDYEMRIGAWDSMLAQLRSKVELSELMPTERSAAAQGMLALAATKRGDAALATWLRGRVELLVDPAELVARRPMLKPLWEGAP